MRFLVTGGAGFIGSNLAVELQQFEKGEVVVLDNFSSGSFENLRSFYGDVVTADVQMQDWWEKVGRVDAVFHQAAITDTTVLDERAMMEANVEGLRSVLAYSEGFGIHRVVYASSAGVYGSGECPMMEDRPPAPENIYGFSKAVGDQLARRFMEEHGEATVVGLRYFNVYGPRESHKGKAASMVWQLTRQMLAGRRPRIFKYGEQSRDFIYVKDAVAANLKALDATKSGVFNVGTGRDETFNRMIEKLNKVLGTSFEPEYFDNPYPFYQNRTQADMRKARDTLGWEARFSLSEGIADYFRLEELAKAANLPKIAGRL